MLWQKIAAARAVTVAAIAIAMAVAIQFNPDTIIEMLYRVTLDVDMSTECHHGGSG